MTVKIKCINTCKVFQRVAGLVLDASVFTICIIVVVVVTVIAAATITQSSCLVRRPGSFLRVKKVDRSWGDSSIHKVLALQE